MNKWKSGCQVNCLCQNPVFAVAVMKNKEESIQVTIALNESSVSATFASSLAKRNAECVQLGVY